MKKKVLKQFRQGDVFIQEVGFDPRKKEHTTVPRDKGKVVLAYGEVTGHSHAIADRAAELIELKDGERFLVTDKGISLRHEEHARIGIPAGNFRITIQREYSPESIRNVAD